jgi:hypothetical protein
MVKAQDCVRAEDDIAIGARLVEGDMSRRKSSTQPLSRIRTNSERQTALSAASLRQLLKKQDKLVKWCM